MTTIIQSDFRTAFQFATAFHRLFSVSSFRRPPTSFRYPSLSSLRIRARAFSTNEIKTDDASSGAYKVSNKPSICTADELHYISVNASHWRLALWRYLPSPQVFKFLYITISINKYSINVKVYF